MVSASAFSSMFAFCAEFLPRIALSGARCLQQITTKICSTVRRTGAAQCFSAPSNCLTFATQALFGVDCRYEFRQVAQESGSIYVDFAGTFNQTVECHPYSNFICILALC